MSQPQLDRTSRASRIIDAAPSDVYNAFVDPSALVEWMPPGNMTGKIHRFDGRVGGGYQMSLYYPDSEPLNRGKTAAKEDRVNVRFVELTPPTQLIEAVNFDSDEASYHGEMTLTATFRPVSKGTEVSIEFTNLPAGVRVEDNDEGARLSLEQLAKRLEHGK